MLISPAFAQATGAPAMGGLESFLPLILIFVVFYFLLIRPQQKKAKQHRELVQQLKRGDRVLTGGGIIGQVSKLVDDNEIEVEVAPNVKVRLVRSAVQDVLQRTQPASGAKDEAAAAEEKPAEKASGLRGLLGGKGK